MSGSDGTLHEFLPTRRSLLTRLKDWDDQQGWREFFETYWRLIYSVATKAGLNDSDAQDIVREQGARLDVAYLRSRGATLGLSPALERTLQAARA